MKRIKYIISPPFAKIIASLFFSPRTKDEGRAKRKAIIWLGEVCVRYSDSALKRPSQRSRKGEIRNEAIVVS